MEEIQVQFLEMVEGDKEPNIPVLCNNHSRNYWRWIRIGIHALFALSGQAAATLLGRNYYEKGGNSQWLSTLAQFGGFPILLPYYCFQSRSKNPNKETNQTKPPSFFILAAVYVTLGMLIAANSFLYSIGLRNLPVSTYSLITASQLAFNSLFSFILNKHRFTQYIINSVVLLTFSSALLVFQNNSDSTTVRMSKQKYAIGFICTVGASAGTGLQLSLMQLAFRKVVKRETFAAILDMIIYPSFVASCATLVGLFASRGWMSLNREMNQYESGKVSYIMTLVWTAISWEIFTVGSIGLIFDTSSLFANAISVVGLPIVPVLAVVFFHDKMNGLKVIAMVLAIWGFLSFVYQHLLDDRKSKTNNRRINAVSQDASPLHLTLSAATNMYICFKSSF